MTKLPPLSKRALATHLRYALEKAAALDPAPRTRSDAACYVLGYVASLAGVDDPFALFDAYKHNALARAKLDELAEQGSCPADLLGASCCNGEREPMSHARGLDALLTMITGDDRQVELFK